LDLRLEEGRLSRYETRERDIERHRFWVLAVNRSGIAAGSKLAQLVVDHR
jgi:hypothetical protein